MKWLTALLGRRRDRTEEEWDCLHHDRYTGETWVREMRVGNHVDLECTRCGGYWP